VDAATIRKERGEERFTGRRVRDYRTESSPGALSLTKFRLFTCLLEGSRLVCQLIFRTRREVLDIIVEVVSAGESLAGD
jgi:hypothetical protein